MPTLVLIIIGMGVSSTISYVKSSEALKNSILGEIKQTSLSTKDLLVSWVKDRKLDIDSWSQQKVYRTAVEKSYVGKSARKTANKQLADLSRKYGYYESIALASPTGELVAGSVTEAIGKMNIKERNIFIRAMNLEMLTGI